MENSDYDLREWTQWWAGIVCTCYIPLIQPFGLNFRKRRVVMIKYVIKIIQNEEKKIKSESSIFLDFTEFIWI